MKSKLSRLQTGIVILMVLFSGSSWAVDRFVGQIGFNHGDCTVMPCRSIQYAIDQSSWGDQILVGPGKYVENIQFREEDITLKSIGGAENTIIDGGGVTTVVRFNRPQPSQQRIEGFTIQNGTGDTQCYTGGGITCFDGASPTIKDCIVRSNYAGGIWCVFGANATISGCTVEKNFQYGIYVQDSSVVIENSTIKGTDFLHFIAIGVEASGSSSVTLRNSKVAGNLGGGIWADGSATVDAVNCFITGNYFDNNGAGISAHESSHVRIANCTISGNSAYDLNRGLGGGGIAAFEGTQLHVVNSIVWNNRTHNGVNDDIGARGGFSIHYSNFRDIHTQWEGVGNLHEDPVFINPRGPESAPFSDGDFHIDTASPCVDAGTADVSSFPLIPSNDFDLQSRPKKNGYDMGADEVVFSMWHTHRPVLEIVNQSDQVCEMYRNGIVRRAKVALFVMDVGDGEPRFWDELVFDGNILPGQSESIGFDWPLDKGTPSGFAKLFWTLELVAENQAAKARGLQSPATFVPPVPPDPTPPDQRPPDPTPPDPTPPRPKTFSVWAFDTDTPRFTGRAPRVPVEVDEEHTRVKFYLFGDQCPDTPVGKVYFHLVKN